MGSVSISTSRRARWATLCALYFAQGVPWGFVTVALVAYLNEQGVSREETALLVSLSIAPWTFKLIWAPLIDTLRFPSLGQRRPWIVFAQLMMAVTLVTASTNADLTAASTLTLLVVVLFCHNCFASLQDVATDAMALDLLLPGERGKVNGFMWGSKIAGISLGGALLATVLVRWGLAAGMQLQALIIVLIMLLPLLIRERIGEKLLPWTEGRPMAPSRFAAITGRERKLVAAVSDKMAALLVELRRAFAHLTTVSALALALVVWLGAGLNEVLMPAVFTQSLGWSAEEYAHVRGIGGGIGEVAGALTGGYLCDRLGRRLTLSLGTLLVSATFIGFAVVLLTGRETGPMVVLFPVLSQTALALSSVAMLALAMKISWTSAAATQFTIYMTLVNVGYAIGPQFTRLGWGDAASFFLCGILSLLPLAVMPFLSPDEITRRQDDDLRILLTEGGVPPPG